MRTARAVARAVQDPIGPYFGVLGLLDLLPPSHVSDFILTSLTRIALPAPTSDCGSEEALPLPAEAGFEASLVLPLAEAEVLGLVLLAELLGVELLAELLGLEALEADALSQFPFTSTLCPTCALRSSLLRSCTPFGCFLSTR
jgi:hypothetical protein